MNAPDYKHLVKTDIQAFINSVDALEKYYGTRHNAERSNISTVAYDVYDSRYGMDAPTIITFNVPSAQSFAKNQQGVRAQLASWLKGVRSKMKKSSAKIASYEKIASKIASEFEFPDLALLIRSVEHTFRLPVQDEGNTLWVLQPNRRFKILGFSYAQTKAGKIILTGTQYADSVQMRHLLVDRANRLIRNTATNF